MAKRFTDTGIWDKEWFMRLPLKHKCLFRFLTEKCDAAGVWEPNWVLASLYIGEPLNESDLLPLNDQIERLDNGKIWLSGFIDFQYGKLSDKSPAHKPVFKSIEKNNLSNRLFNRVSNTLQEKEKEKDKEEEKERVGRLKRTLSDVEYFESPEKAFEEIKNDELMVERMLRTVHQNGFRACDEFILMKSVRYFITQESAKPEFEYKPRDAIKSHLVNWLAKNVNKLNEYAK